MCVCLNNVHSMQSTQIRAYSFHRERFDFNYNFAVGVMPVPTVNEQTAFANKCFSIFVVLSIFLVFYRIFSFWQLKIYYDLFFLVCPVRWDFLLYVCAKEWHVWVSKRERCFTSARARYQCICFNMKSRVDFSNGV